MLQSLPRTFTTDCLPTLDNSRASAQRRLLTSSPKSGATSSRRQLESSSRIGTLVVTRTCRYAAGLVGRTLLNTGCSQCTTTSKSLCTPFGSTSRTPRSATCCSNNSAARTASSRRQCRRWLRCRPASNSAVMLRQQASWANMSRRISVRESPRARCMLASSKPYVGSHNHMLELTGDWSR